MWLHTLTLTLTLILFLQPETTTTFGSVHRLCQVYHSNYDLSTPTLTRICVLAKEKAHAHAHRSKTSSANTYIYYTCSNTSCDMRACMEFIHTYIIHLLYTHTHRRQLDNSSQLSWWPQVYTTHAHAHAHAIFIHPAWATAPPFDSTADTD